MSLQAKNGNVSPVVCETPPDGKHYFIISRLGVINCSPALYREISTGAKMNPEGTYSFVDYPCGGMKKKKRPVRQHEPLILFNS
jgi:hypothetical protein